jgi:hypothetical protein
MRYGACERGRWRGRPHPFQGGAQARDEVRCYRVDQKNGQRGGSGRWPLGEGHLGQCPKRRTLTPVRWEVKDQKETGQGAARFRAATGVNLSMSSIPLSRSGESRKNKTGRRAPQPQTARLALTSPKLQFPRGPFRQTLLGRGDFFAPNPPSHQRNGRRNDQAQGSRRGGSKKGRREPISPSILRRLRSL